MHSRTVYASRIGQHLQGTSYLTASCRIPVTNQWGAEIPTFRTAQVKMHSYTWIRLACEPRSHTLEDALRSR
ncbi:hypothetical protein Leryth_003925 [Lithospermum erythrorhizon]|nr:hypothetical protein Leryth_003925 [Lithospermum erythrorhizon]